MLTLTAATTALILIDLQRGIVAMPTTPRSGEAVLAKGKELARRFRAAKAPVVLVNVAFSPDFGDALKAPVDRPPNLPAAAFPKAGRNWPTGSPNLRTSGSPNANGVRSMAPSSICSSAAAASPPW